MFTLASGHGRLYNEAREDGRKKTKGMYMPLLHHYIDNKHAVEALGIIKDAVDDGAVVRPFRTLHIQT
jgi:lysyl-tRNA synthetase class II